MESAGMTLDEVKSLIRKEYGFFESPKKADRLFLTEEHWEQIDWTDEEQFINAALPHKLWNMRADDQVWPLCKTFRGESAYGHRAGEDHSKYFPKLPELVEGRGIARWMSAGDHSVLYIPVFKDFSNTWRIDNIPFKLEVKECNPGNLEFGKLFEISRESLLQNYAPSSIQKFSHKSYLKRFPYHVSSHIMINQREIPGFSQSNTGNDSVFFWRAGWRWDSLDSYFIRNGFFAGLRWN